MRTIDDVSDTVSIVPVIDISAWSGGSERTRRAIAAELDDACRRIGFFQIVGHGVPDTVRARLIEMTDAFFDLPLDEKQRYLPPDPAVNRGYAAMGSEGLSYSLGVDTPPDLFEAFNIGVGAPPSERDDPVVFAANIWPERPAGFRDALEAYFAAAKELAERLTEIVALALDLPEGYFADKTDRSVDVLRANHYRRRPGEPEPVAGQMRMGPHTDYGILTVLFAEAVPGLQIVGPDGAWHDVLPRADGFVVNLGDALAVWTNDRWKSTLHRVVPPPPSAGESRRRSFAFFHDGNLDAVIECLPSCCGPGNPPKYEPITLGEHVRQKLLGPRTLQQSVAQQTVGERATAV
jgi:isopenicillin N synthase-like dioxygenase